jgi:uncharacterized protein YlxP (DUF503 family)
MLVALERFDLRIPTCRSLKAKRHVLKALTNGLRSTFNASVAEVEYQDLWQRAAIGVAVVAGEAFQARRVIEEIERFVDRFAEVEVIASDRSFHDVGD